MAKKKPKDRIHLLAAANPACAAQHFGAWSVRPSWFAQAWGALMSGTLSPLPSSGAAQGRPPYQLQDGVAVIRIEGYMTKGESSFGGCSTVNVRRAIRAAGGDPAVNAILLHIDSPGGTCAGTQELADDVAEANRSKPVVAYVSDCCCSAAYWVASQCREIHVNATAVVGSIGTMMLLYDTSQQHANAGIVPYLVSTGAYKGAGSDGIEVLPEHLAEFRREVDALNAHFLDAVMEGRRLGESELNELADGRVFIGSEAVSNGLVDFVTTWDDAISAVIKMTNEQIEKYIEDNPDSAPIGAIRADAYGRGLSDGAAQVRQTLAALAAEFPDDPGFALQQAGKGADVLSAKAAFADVLRARMSRRETPVQHVNPAEPQAALPLAAPTISVDADAGPDESDPKARAEWEWDHDGEARKSFSSKENYVGFRVAEMTGRLRVHVAR